MTPIRPAELVGTVAATSVAGGSLIIFIDDSISGSVLTVNFTAAATNTRAIVSQINNVTGTRVVASEVNGRVALSSVEEGFGVFLSVYDTPASSTLGLAGLDTAQGSVLCDDGKCAAPVRPARLVGTATPNPPRVSLAGEQLEIYVDDSAGAVLRTVTFTAAATTAAAIVREINAVMGDRLVASEKAGHVVLTTLETGPAVYLEISGSNASSILGFEGVGASQGTSG